MNFRQQKYILRIEASTKCNQKCVFCPQSRCKLANQVMPFETYTSIINSVAKQRIPIEIINFSGMGEPLTDPLLFERVAYGKRLCKKFQLYTNGRLLVGDTLKRVAESFYRVYFSFHGNTIEEYETFTGNDFYKMKAIYHEAKQALGNRLVLSNHPEGKLHEALEAGPITASDLHPFHNFGDTQVKERLKGFGVDASMDGQRYCELCLFIIFRVDGSLATCCNDWDSENHILSGDYPKCNRCFCAGHFKELISNGKLRTFENLLAALDECKKVLEDSF